jgi:outer membrane immunogenic protein
VEFDMKRILTAALLAPALLAGPAATAADLPRGGAYSGDYYAPPPEFSWQGFYLGVNGGYGFGAFRDGNDRLLGEPDGWLVGATGGYNHAFGRSFLLGLEADFDFGGGKSGGSPFAGLYGRSAVDNILTARARAGMTFDRALFFVTGGFAGAVTTAAIGNAFAGFWGQQTSFQPGWTLGAGVEFGILPNLSAKAEYLFASVGGDRYFDFTTNGLQANIDTSMVRGGVNYHF